LRRFAGSPLSEDLTALMTHRKPLVPAEQNSENHKKNCKLPRSQNGAKPVRSKYSNVLKPRVMALPAPTALGTRYAPILDRVRCASQQGRNAPAQLPLTPALFHILLTLADKDRHG
jgi:hypothetical protein